MNDEKTMKMNISEDDYPNIVLTKARRYVYSLAIDAALLSYPKDSREYDTGYRHRDEALAYLTKKRDLIIANVPTIEGRLIDRIINAHKRAEDNF